jgi:hypothetical protein
VFTKPVDKFVENYREPNATLGGIRNFLVPPIFFARLKIFNFNDLANRRQTRDVAPQQHGDCQENVHKSSPLLQSSLPASSRTHSR